MKTLYIIRGIPGSGKTTYAKNVLKLTPFEADDFFCICGKYRYVADMVPKAHEYCFRNVENAMRSNQESIAVANTFTRKWEYQRYLTLAERYGYKVIIHICTGNYPNVHDVPEKIVERMKERFEY